MSEPLSSASSLHIYRPPLWRRVIALLSWVFFLLFAGAPLWIFTAQVIQLALKQPEARPIVSGAMCLLAPMGLILLWLLFHLTMIVFSFFFTTALKITPTGLEYRAWPYIHVRCTWSDLDRVAKFLFSDLLYLQSYQIIGPSLSIKSFWRRFSFEKQLSIPLSSLAGWPNGGLAADLHLYAPRLFDSATGKPLIPASQPVQGPSKDERLYAALSHAGVWLFPVFLPLAFWLSERKKSAYVGMPAGSRVAAGLPDPALRPDRRQPGGFPAHLPGRHVRRWAGFIDLFVLDPLRRRRHRPGLPGRRLPLPPVRQILKVTRIDQQ
jgi:hypothetical protein